MYSPVLPSVVHIYYSLFRYLSNHPLLNYPLVFDPLTQEQIPISQYRFIGGLATNTGLTCSIYPGFSSNATYIAPSPATISASVLYKPYNLGNNEDEARFHFVIEYQYQSLVADGINQIADSDLITTPTNYVVYPQDVGLTSSNTQSLTLFISPAQDIVANYLELTRFALCDRPYHRQFLLGDHFPGTLENVEIIHQNFESIHWEKHTNAAFCKGYLLIGLTAYLTRDWRKIFNIPLTKVDLDLDKIKKPKMTPTINKGDYFKVTEEL